MSSDNESYNPGVNVDDESETVDRRVKKRILDSRERVNEREDTLFTESLLDPQLDIPQERLVATWGHTVRQFLRDIRPLLRNPDFDESTHYYSEVELGEIVLYPPRTDERDYTRISRTNMADEVLRQSLNLPRSAELPRAKRTPIHGLKALIEMEPVQQATWTVKTDDTGPPPSHEYETLQQVKPIPKSVYERAVMSADEFLQENGLGIDIEPNPYRSQEPGL